MLISITLLGVISVGLAPVLISSSKASYTAKQETQAKGLTTSRIASMRSLPYHVAFQNGTYVDLLDQYYTSTSTSPSPIPASSGTGTYSTGTVPGQSVSGPYYKVSFAAPTLPVGYTQTVYTQFLSPNTQSGGSGDSIVSPPSTYTSQATGLDAPPSLLLGVTIVTTYGTHSYRVATEITDTGHDKALVLGQAGTTALAVDSHTYDGSLLSAVVGAVGLNGALSNSSNASADATGVRFRRLDPGSTVNYLDALGAFGAVATPPDPASAGDQNAGGVSSAVPGMPCGWGSANATTTRSVSATVAAAQPRIPADVESGSSPKVTAGLFLGSASSGCGAFWMSNALPGSTPSPVLGLPAGQPQVSIPASSSSGAQVVGAASVDTTAVGSSTPVTSGATVTGNSAPMEIFPGMPFVTDTTYDRALVVVRLATVSIACTASVASATASYQATVLVWQQASATSPGQYVTTSLNWTSGSPNPALLPLTTPVTWVGGLAVPLSNWIQNWKTNDLIQQAPVSGATGSVGNHVVPGVLTIDTQPTLLLTPGGAVDPESDLLLTIGRVSCVSEDTR